jgi:hypothetical protein
MEQSNTLSQEEIDAEEIRKMGVFFSPEALIMLPIAILLDIAGIAFTILDIAYGIGEIPSWISDGIGIIFFGLWILIRSQTMARPKALAEKVIERRKTIVRAVKQLRKMGRGLRFAISVIGELVPIIGALPFWTWFVYSELKS